jgi:hypothetical protein
MFGLAKQIRALGYPVTTYTWNNWEKIVLYGHDVIIGYSGGGSRATWLVDKWWATPIDLMVLYDPSPKWQMEPIGPNVKKAICYQNMRPLMFGLGGGVLTRRGSGSPILVRKIKEQHLAVQYDQTLHAATIQAIKDVSS